MTGEDIGALAEEISALMRDRLGLRGRSLAERTRRAGRMLPRGLRRDARLLAEAAAMAAHPRLARRVDAAAAAAAHGRLRAHLLAIDRAEQRTTRALNLLAVIAVNLLLLAGLVLAVLAWRGFL